MGILFALLALARASPTTDVPPVSPVPVPPPELRSYISELSRAGLSAEMFNRPVKPRANLVVLFSTSDYPREAVLKEEQGIVSTVLRVAADGRVADCIVAESSGSASLDVQTCRILWKRARFEPARDGKGRPVESAYRQRIKWVLPQAEPTPIKPWSVRMTLDVVQDGGVISCHMETTGALQSDPDDCDFFTGLSNGFFPKIRADAGYQRQKIVLETQFSPGEHVPVANPPAGTRLHIRQVARLTIDATGKPLQCKVIETVGPLPPPGGCNDLLGDVYEKPGISLGAVEATIARHEFVGE